MKRTSVCMVLPRSFHCIRQGCRQGWIKHSALGDISIWFCCQSSSGERSWRELGASLLQPTLFPMDLSVFEGSLKTLISFCSIFFFHLGPATWLVSGGGTFLSLLSDMWVFSKAFRKGPWTCWRAAISIHHVEHTWVAWREKVRAHLPLVWLPLPRPLRPQYRVPICQVPCTDLRTAAAKLACKKFCCAEFCGTCGSCLILSSSLI